jgi:general secretion pathway protein G
MTRYFANRRPVQIGSKALRGQRGFTLLELLVTLTILALLATIVTPQVLKYIQSSRVQTARLQVQSISAALDLFQVDVGRYPSAQEGLQSLVAQPDGLSAWGGPYLKKASGLVDPWGIPYHYRIPGQHGDVDVFSYGGGKTDGASDETPQITNW